MAIERIVAGIDDSDDSYAALDFAAEAARLRGATLEVVSVYPPVENKAAFPAMPMSRDAATEMEGKRKQAAQEAIERAVAKLGDAGEGLKIEANPMRHERASAGLIERSKEADMLVVAHRGRGGFKDLRLGSTSEQVVRHAHCPVMVVRPNTR